MSLVYPRCRALLTVILDGFSVASTQPISIQVAPRNATICRNSYQEADTWELEIDAKALPLVPEMIRSLTAEVHLWSAKSADPNEDAAVGPTTRRIVGLCDNAQFALSDSGRSLSMSGRDFTALLLDQQWGARNRVPVGRPLDVTVRNIVERASVSGRYGNLSVVWKADVPPPVVGGKRKGSLGAGVPVRDNDSVWDVVYRLCLRHGFIVFVDGHEVIISTPGALTAAEQGRVRHMAWGRNLATLEVERKLGKERVPQIEVRSYDPKQRKAIAGRYPASAKQVTSAVGTKRDEIRIHSMPDVQDVKTLERIAKSMYDSLARSEAMIRWSTHSLASLAVDPDSSDLLALAAGDPVYIGFDPFNDVEMRRLNDGARYAHLRELGYSDAISKLIATDYELLEQLNRPYYTRAVTISYSHEQGVTIDAECANYVAPQRDA